MAYFLIYLQKKLKRPFVYVVRKRALGDVLWIEPVVRQLAATNKKVIVYTKYPDLFLNYPLSNVVFKSKIGFFEKLLWKAESFLKASLFVIDLEMASEKNPRIHFLHAYQQKAGLPMVMEYPKLYLSKEESKPAATSQRKYVLLHLESLTDKNYRKVYGVNWEDITKNLESKGFLIVQIGKESLNIPGTIHVKTSIREMISLINKSSFFIGIDSGPSHIASALGIPSLIFFGAVNPDLRHFRNLFKGYFLQQYCEYAGCYHETISVSGPSCRLVGDGGIPKCSLHTTEYVLRYIDLLIQEYAII